MKSDVKINQHVPTRETDLAWAAGIVDGEGCIHIRRRWPHPNTRQKSVYHMLRLSVNNTDPKMPEKLQDLFGGRVSQRIPTVRAQERNHRIQYVWEIAGMHAAEAIASMLPYFVTKESQGLLAIEFHNLYVITSPHSDRDGMDPDELAQRDAYYWALREAKLCML